MTAGLAALSAPAEAATILPARDLYLASEHFVGVNRTGWSIDATAGS
jgi:hypothetical protein